MIKRSFISLFKQWKLAEARSHSSPLYQRFLLKNNNLLMITNRLSLSTVTPDESKKNAEFYTLKEQNGRLKSVDFVKKIKKSCGEVAQFDIPRAAFDALAAEYDILLDEVDSYKDKYTRALAEVENVRRRGQRQIEETKVFAIQGFCKDLLEVADILDLAVASVKADELESNSSLKNLFEGLEMTKGVLEKTFIKHGLTKVHPEGKKFDPSLHEAVFQVPKEKSDLESGCVAQVLKVGYSLQNRPVRAAKVGVVQ